MKFSQLFVLSLAMTPSVVSAALFPEGSLVKMIDHKGFKEAMKQNMTSVVAFVAPWCGHCQRLAPEYSKAALGLYPLVPLYAVDCDAPKNRRLCADQDVKGFPTVKLYPRGKTLPPIEYTDAERKASNIFYFASRGIPNNVKKIRNFDDLIPTINSNTKKPRALLMNKSNKLPLLWSTLANKYSGKVSFYTRRDRRGKESVKLGFEAGDDGVAKVLIFPAGETEPMQYAGIMKYDSLSKFFDSIIDGTADYSALNAAAAKEEFIPDEKELEIERQQEAEMLKLAHGGYADIIDFESAVKDGSAKNYHAQHGYPGMMDGSVSDKYVKKQGDEKEKEAVSLSSTTSSSTATVTNSKKHRMPITGEGGQIVLDLPTSTNNGQPKTPMAEPTEVIEEVQLTESIHSVTEVPSTADAEPTEVRTDEDGDVFIQDEAQSEHTTASQDTVAEPTSEPLTEEIVEETGHFKDEL